MKSVWLRANTRALLLGMIPASLTALVGCLLALGWLPGLDALPVRVVGGVLLMVGLLLEVGLAWQMSQPRLACQSGELLVYLRSGGPIRVPLEVVECFLLGQTPALLSGRQHERSETASVLIKLADSATDWSRRDVKPALGKWCEGYITLRGTWCEPLDIDTVQRLNRLLDEAHREARKAQEARQAQQSRQAQVAT